MSLPTFSSLQIWTIVLPITAVIILIIRKTRNKPLNTLDLESCIASMLALYAIVSSLNIIYQTLSSPKIQELLGSDNIPVLVIGFFAVIWISIKEIGKVL